jgi:hypothetical protein
MEWIGLWDRPPIPELKEQIDKYSISHESANKDNRSRSWPHGIIKRPSNRTGGGITDRSSWITRRKRLSAENPYTFGRPFNKDCLLIKKVKVSCPESPQRGEPATMPPLDSIISYPYWNRNCDENDEINQQATNTGADAAFRFTEIITR